MGGAGSGKGKRKATTPPAPTLRPEGTGTKRTVTGDNPAKELDKLEEYLSTPASARRSRPQRAALVDRKDRSWAKTSPVHQVCQAQLQSLQYHLLRPLVVGVSAAIDRPFLARPLHWPSKLLLPGPLSIQRSTKFLTLIHIFELEREGATPWGVVAYLAGVLGSEAGRGEGRACAHGVTERSRDGGQHGASAQRGALLCTGEEAPQRAAAATRIPLTSKPRETARMKRLEFGMAEGEELPLLELQRHEMERLRTLLDEQRATIARHRAELDAREETIREQQARLEAQAEELCALRQRCAGGERAGRVGGGAERSVGASPAEQLARALEDKAVLVAQLQRLVDAAAQARVEARRQAEVSQRSLAAAWRLGELGRAGIALVREASDPPTPT
ncbi:hypothetical protein AB1Y20_022028 [Prymnesium parvum]|uniref:Uncharacterized protein n=1 Tax=Prymnesium parvum TaxID=97485 RepID=A0AB34JF52_PRYPA